MKQLIRTQWMWGAVSLAIIIINIILNVTKAYPNYWIYIFAFVGALLYIAFWAIQFMGITQLEQYKQLFQKFRYEIDSRQIFVKVSDKEGGVMKWDMILKAEKTQDAYVMELGKAQFLYLPFDIFTSDNDRKLMDKILRDKGLVL
jgi:DNA integrity scanning protein DisA with diadenylate cyclase activity